MKEKADVKREATEDLMDGVRRIIESLVDPETLQDESKISSHIMNF